MRKQLFFFVFAGLAVFFGAASPACAQTGISGAAFPPSRFAGTSTDISAIKLLADNGSGYEDFSSVERSGAVFLNFLFGAGSYSMGDIKHGVFLTFLEAGGIALVVLPGIFGWEIGLSGNQKDDSLTKNYDERLTPGGNAAILCYAAGAVFLLTDIILNFYYPLTYHRPAAKTARLTDARNWNAAYVPGNNGKDYGQITFTAHF